MPFDMNPKDDDIHGQCRHEIQGLLDTIESYKFSENRWREAAIKQEDKIRELESTLKIELAEIKYLEGLFDSEEEAKHIKELSVQFMNLENFFASTENKVPEFPIQYAIQSITLRDDTIVRLKRNLQTAIDHLKDSFKLLTELTEYKPGDHWTYKEPYISVEHLERLNKTIAMLEDI